MDSAILTLKNCANLTRLIWSNDFVCWWYFVLSMYRRWQDGAARFEEFMARHAEESRDDIQAIKNLNVFYQVGFQA